MESAASTRVSASSSARDVIQSVMEFQTTFVPAGGGIACATNERHKSYVVPHYEWFFARDVLGEMSVIYGKGVFPAS